MRLINRTEAQHVPLVYPSLTHVYVDVQDKRYNAAG